MISFGVGQKNTTSIDSSCANKSRQRLLVNNSAVEKRPEIANRRFLDDLYAEKSVSQRIDTYDDVSELGR